MWPLATRRRGTTRSLPPAASAAPRSGKPEAGLSRESVGRLSQHEGERGSRCGVLRRALDRSTQPQGDLGEVVLCGDEGRGQHRLVGRVPVGGGLRRVREQALAQGGNVDATRHLETRFEERTRLVAVGDAEEETLAT